MPAPRPIEFRFGDPTAIAELASSLGRERSRQRDIDRDRDFLNRELDRRAQDSQIAAEFALRQQELDLEAQQQSAIARDQDRAFALQRAGAALANRERTPTGGARAASPLADSIRQTRSPAGATRDAAGFTRRSPITGAADVPQGGAVLTQPDGSRIMFDPTTGQFTQQADTVVRPDGSIDFDALAGRELIDPQTGELDLSAFNPATPEAVSPRGVFPTPQISPEQAAIESLIQGLPPGTESFANALRTMPFDDAVELAQTLREKHEVNQRAAARLKSTERLSRVRNLRRDRDKIEDELDKLRDPLEGDADPSREAALNRQLAEIEAEISGLRNPDFNDPAIREPTDNDIDDAIRAVGTDPQAVEQFLRARGFQF